MNRLILAGGVTALCICSAALWFLFYPSSKASVAIAADNSSTAQQCHNVSDKDLSVAYKVHAKVESQINQQNVYQSDLTFNTQLQQATENKVFGKATDINITETLAGQTAGQSHNIDDVLYLTQLSNTSRVIFSAYNDLGLATKHPMSILSQLMKNLSVGEEGQTYSFDYDQLKGQYRYHSNADRPLDISRELMVNNAASKVNSQWQLQLDQNCLPQSMLAEETLPIGSGSNSGFIRFSMTAERIPDYADLLKIAYSPKANANNQWQVATVDAAAQANEVTSEAQMWQIMNAFSQNKNTAQLVRAVNYMMEHMSSYDLTQMIIAKKIDEKVLRDVIFGMSLSTNSNAEEYMIEVMDYLPANSGKDIDMQKLRLMVAISGNSQVSDVAFRAFTEISDSNSESENVRRTALINLGTVVRQMAGKSLDTSYESQALSTEILKKMDDKSAYAAIFSAGNAGLDHLDDKVNEAVVNKLTSNNSRERYASAKVLAHDSGNYDLLINQLGSEKSTLVSAAIISGLKAGKLSSTQRSQLQTIAANAPAQIKKQLNHLLGTDS